MSTQKPAYFIEPLSDYHDRKKFFCGVDALDRYFWQQAGQEARKHIAATFVLIDADSRSLMGYYTLSAIGIEVGELPEEIIKKLPKYPLMPATLLGRLAVAKKYQGNKLGELLLLDALQRSLRLSQEIASMAIVVDAKDERAENFYKKYGFILFPKSSKKLFLPMTTVGKLFVKEVSEWKSIQPA